MAEYDLIIIGAGPAGLSAGINAARNGLKTAIISRDIGGTANSILRIENWPGFKGTGMELIKGFYEHLKEYDIEVLTANIESIEKKPGYFIVRTKKQEFESKTLIIATGTERKKLNIEGEKELVGKGVSYCVMCDGFFFKDKTVAIIGGSDSAADSALNLSNIAKEVYVIYRREKLRCEDINLKKLETRKNVKIIYNAVPKKIIGKEKTEALVIEESGKEKEIKLDGIFIEIGFTPSVEFIKKLGLKIDKENHIIVDENMKTSVPGVFAAGDVTNHKIKQVVVSASQGAIAAKSVSEYIKKK